MEKKKETKTKAEINIEKLCGWVCEDVQIYKPEWSKEKCIEFFEEMEKDITDGKGEGYGRDTIFECALDEYEKYYLNQE